MSVNRVILIGNVGQDPRVKYFDTGSAVATFPLATTDRGYTLANGTQIPERTEWHNIVASNRLAEIVDKYVHKGDKLYLEGKIRTRSYSDQSGAMRYITEIYVDNMEMLLAEVCRYGLCLQNEMEMQAMEGRHGEDAVRQLADTYRNFAKKHREPAMGQQQQPVAGQSQQAQQSQAQPAQDNPTDDLPF